MSSFCFETLCVSSFYIYIYCQVYCVGTLLQKGYMFCKMKPQNVEVPSHSSYTLSVALLFRAVLFISLFSVHTYQAEYLSLPGMLAVLVFSASVPSENGMSVNVCEMPVSRLLQSVHRHKRLGVMEAEGTTLMM